MTGCRRGPDFGKFNPFNTVRNEHSKQEKKDLADDGDKGPDPFNHEEARAILTVFRKTPRLRPYWPLVGLLMATGARPNEICALPWRNVLGLWEGFTMRSDQFIWTPEDRSLHGTPVFLNTAVEWTKAKNVLRTERFKCTKNQNERMPRVNRYIPGYEDLFKQCIEARLPARLEITNLPEFRDMLVFQGPRVTQQPGGPGGNPGAVHPAPDPPARRVQAPAAAAALNCTGRMPVPGRAA